MHSIKMSDKWDLSNKSIALFFPKISPPAVSYTGCSVMKEPRLKRLLFFSKLGFHHAKANDGRVRRDKNRASRLSPPSNTLYSPSLYDFRLTISVLFLYLQKNTAKLATKKF